MELLKHILENIDSWLSPKSSSREYRILSSGPEAERFKWYCSASYSRKEQKPEYRLEKVVILHRHGDRAPVSMTEGSGWENEKCVVCEYKKEDRAIGPCSKRNCRDGDLTVKGYGQLRSLGRFIKVAYGELLGTKCSDIRRVDFRATSIGRTHSSLHGLVNGIKKVKVLGNVNVHEDDSLLNPSNCKVLDTIMRRTHMKGFSGKQGQGGEGMSPERAADNYWTHMCNMVGINCNALDCGESSVWKYLEISTEVWREQARMASENRNASMALFGRFGKELAEIIQNDTRMHVYSAHDGSLSSVLIGLGTGIYDKPPYGGAIFIEKWANGEKKFVRIVYNNEICKTLIDEDTNIPLEKFLSHLRDLAVEHESLKDLCSLKPRC